MKKTWRIGKVGLLLLAVGAAAGAAVLAYFLLPFPWIRPTDSPAITQQLLSVQRVQRLSQLTTLKLQVADAQVTRLQGHTGSIQAVLVVRGQVNVGVDLALARFEQVQSARQRAVLVLPAPQVQSIGLDHEHTRLIGVWPEGLWQLAPGGRDADTAAVNLAYRQAQRALGDVANDPALLQRARQQAEQVLQAFFQALGWEVRIRWTEGATSTLGS